MSRRLVILAVIALVWWLSQPGPAEPTPAPQPPGELDLAGAFSGETAADDAAIVAALAGELADCIEFDKVSFTYPNTTTRVLDELSFRINKGEMVAFVGSSGAGKSTIADLILGLYDPSSGAVRMDGVDVTHAKASSWRDHFGVVSQESFLFNATVRENIAFGSPAAFGRVCRHD